MMRLRLGFFILTGAVAFAAAGCGTSAAAPTTTNFNAPSKTEATPAPSPSSASATPTPTPTPVSSSSSPSAHVSPTAKSPSVSTPAPPQAGVFTAMTIRVSHIATEGQQTQNGVSLNVLALTVTIANPTSAMIPLHLNDFTVEKQGAAHYAYSNNDVSAAGLTSSTSLFTLPVDATHPGSVTMYIQPGSSNTGVVTVEVPPASAYQVLWAGRSTPAATFSS